MVNPFGGKRLDEPLVFRLEHPIRHNCKTYNEFTFRRRVSLADLAAGHRIKNDDRKMTSVVLGRLAKVPGAVFEKIHPKDLYDLVNGTAPLFVLV